MHQRRFLLGLAIIVLVTHLGVAPLWAVIPAGYYDPAEGKTGEVLKSALHDIISDHTKYPYTSSNTDVWDILKDADEDPNNSANVILLYTGRSHPKSDNSGENSTYSGNRWNREHVWSKSHGFPSESDTAYTDCHHLRAADESVNSDRSDYDFDESSVQHSEATYCYYDDTQDTWEPRDEVKGDIARMMFYMVVRYDPGYHSDNSTYDLELVDTSDTSYPDPQFGNLSTLLDWHQNDPVDASEQNRNEVVFGYQGNRNPFVDHPEYVNQVFGGQSESGASLMISGVYDGPRSGGTPKGVELYVVNDIVDLSQYGIGSANNGGGSDGQEFTFPAVSATAGDFIYVSYEDTEFASWFSKSTDYTSSSMSINGDDAIELFCEGDVIDLFGDVNVDGTGQSWEYLDGWTYRKSGHTPNPAFDVNQWTLSGVNALDGESNNATAATPFPEESYSTNDQSLPVTLSHWEAVSDYAIVELRWTTESEIENQGFRLNRRTELSRWKHIAGFSENPQLRGQGSSASKQVYTWIDKDVHAGETYLYQLVDVDYRGAFHYHPTLRVKVSLTNQAEIPDQLALHAAYPNPFNPHVRLSYTLFEETDQLDFSIFNLRGELVKTLASNTHPPGIYHHVWNGKTNSGTDASAGIYILRLSTNGHTAIQRITYLK